MSLTTRVTNHSSFRIESLVSQGTPYFGEVKIYLVSPVFFTSLSLGLLFSEQDHHSYYEAARIRVQGLFSERLRLGSQKDTHSLGQLHPGPPDGFHPDFYLPLNSSPAVSSGDFGSRAHSLWWGGRGRQAGSCQGTWVCRLRVARGRSHSGY